MGTPDHNEGCLLAFASYEPHHSQSPDGSAVRSQDPKPRSQALREPDPPRPLTLRETPATPTPHLQSGIHEGAGRVKGCCFALFVVGGRVEANRCRGRRISDGLSTHMVMEGAPGSGDTDVAGSSPDVGRGGSVPGHSSATHNVVAWSATATATTGLIHMRRPAPRVGSCLIASSQLSPCPNLTPPP